MQKFAPIKTDSYANSPGHQVRIGRIIDPCYGRGMEACPLCQSTETENLKSGRYAHCLNCDLRFLLPRFRLSEFEESQRYRFHQNNIQDEKYQKFVEPIVEIISDQAQSFQLGLDYGCGSGPVATHLLRQKQFQVDLYDPLFYPDSEIFNKKYDYIFAIEVVEHFFDVRLNFKKIFDLLKPGSFFAMMTLFFENSIRFEDWYYPKDPTHVSFYSRNTCLWISKHFGLSEPQFYKNRIAIFKNHESTCQRS